MKRLLIMMLVAVAMLCTTTTAWAQNKRELRAEYACKNLSLTKEVKAKFYPVVLAYLNELHDATDEYSDYKDELKDAIKSQTISDKVADRLMSMKLNADAKEANLKRKYAAKFKAIIGAKKTWYCFDLLNDKMSKVKGEKKDN